MESVRERMQEFKITLQNKFKLLNKNKEGVSRLNDNLTTAITESAAAVGEACI